ncbi:hypothetical protein Cni_G00573 [Canna indica]|uniref:Uncharacterized protein n=1 Tax=Canna indica TaxID=4628 RepID=A0AAQ3Q0M7_9LILI|nr:hypothetical protein Cni_G00573 [Canna indica]
MARAEAVLVCLLIVAMDVAAGVFGMEAEAAQNKGRHLKLFFIECKEPVRQAYKFGLAAAALLGLSHAIANVLGGCACICSGEQWSKSSPSRRMAAATLILSWTVVVVGFTMLIIGAMSNSKSRATCGLSRRRFLSIGGILCFVHGLLCLIYYVCADASRKDEGTTHGFRA